MLRITFVEKDGTEYEVDAVAGISLMQNAVDAGVPGISADCGGYCSCGTCHCYIHRDWVGRLSPPTQEERDMLEGLTNPKANSRLTCQIMMRDALDGIRIRLPDPQ